MLAATELAGAAAIWLWRGRTRSDDRGDDHGDDHRGWWGRDKPEGPRGGDLPDEYWQRWEEQLSSPTAALDDHHDFATR
jgi:hypothetical protein